MTRREARVMLRDNCKDAICRPLLLMICKCSLYNLIYILQDKIYKKNVKKSVKYIYIKEEYIELQSFEICNYP